jgi:hypothetical protein
LNPVAAPLWRAFPWNPAAAEGERFSAAFVPGGQGKGRFDLGGNARGVLYLAETPEHAVGEILQRYRNQEEPLDDADLILWGHRLALVSVNLESTVWTEIADLCDPETLVADGIRPDSTAARIRATSQGVAATVFDAGRAGLRWWSAFFGEWHTLVLFVDRLAPGALSYGTPEPLHLTTAHLTEAVRLLDIGRT